MARKPSYRTSGALNSRGRAVNITLELQSFQTALALYFDKSYPEATARGFGEVARRARNAIRERTRQVYDLHSDFIPRGIWSTPDREVQIRAAARSFAKYGDLEAAVFLRPANGKEKNSLKFMIPHETGEAKTPKGKALAIPAQGLEGYQSKTGSGATKKAYRPAQLLSGYNSGKSTLPAAVVADMINNPSSHNPNNRKGQPFIIKSSKGVALLVRRKSGNRLPLDVLYSFKPRAQIRSDWEFETTVRTDVLQQYGRVMKRYVNRGA